MHILFQRRRCAAGFAMFSCAAVTGTATAQTIDLPAINVRAPSPIVTVTPAPNDRLQGTLPIVTDQFATVTVVPGSEIRRNGASTLGDLLFDKPGITGSGFAPGAASRPIVRGLDVNRVRMQDNGIGNNGASDLGEDHFVPADPLATEKVEVIRGPATLRYGSQAIGGVVETSNNRIPTFIPPRGVAAEWRGAFSSVDNGTSSALLLDAGAGNFAAHGDIFGRRTGDYRVPSYPYLNVPDPAELPNATRPGAFNGKQPNSSIDMWGGAAGGSYFFDGGFLGFAVEHNNTIYGIPGADPENERARIDGQQTRILGKGEWRAPNAAIDALRYWFGVSDYKHNELALADPTVPGSDGVRQTFTNKEQEVRVEAQFAPVVLPFAQLVTAIGIQGGHQELAAPSPDNAGLFDPNDNRRIAAYLFNEFRFSPTTRAQIAGRIEHADLDGTGRTFTPGGLMTTTPANRVFAPVSVSAGIIQDLPWAMSASLTGQYVERAPKPAELFSGGPHEATVTFDKGNPNLGIESAASVEAGLRRAQGPFRFELTGYYTRFGGFIYRRLTGNTCDDAGVCGPGVGELQEAFYTQRDATFRGIEWQSQFDLLPVGSGMFGIDNQFDIVRATFNDGSNVPRIPPIRIGGGVYWRDANWLARVNLLHAFPQNDVAPGETATPGYNNLRAELSYTWRKAQPLPSELSEFTLGISGTNLLDDDMRNSASFNKDDVLLPGASVRVFASVKY
jgi:iron complex outermembrane receptor protein